jgi:hypothetical protein
MNFNSFSPKEVIFLYLRHRRYIDVHNQVTESIKELNKEGVETQPSLRDLRDNSHIRLLEELNEKLLPIYELIASTDPDLIDEVKIIVENPMNLPDSPIEEDMEGDDNDLF